MTTAGTLVLSTGNGNAGTITVSAVRLLMNDGSAISTEAVGERSIASGGNITLHIRDFLHLVSSEISTSVRGRTGNGGNISIDPQLVILAHSIIKVDAIAGNGGNITITADQFILSSVLTTQLRSRIEVLREAGEARAGQPISNLVEAGRGGLPQNPEANLPALYIAGRDVNPNPPAAGSPTEASKAVPTTVHLTMRCG